MKNAAFKKLMIFSIIFSGFSLSNLAKAGPVFDIYSVFGDDHLGHIEFSSGGILSSVANILDFDYTSKHDGLFFDETNLSMLNVLVDTSSGQLCWGDWTAGMTSVTPGSDCGRQTDPTTFSPYGLTGLSGVNFIGFWSGGKHVFSNRASDAGDDDEDLYFVMRDLSSRSASVPEPLSLALLVTGLLGMRLRRMKFQTHTSIQSSTTRTS